MAKAIAIVSEEAKARAAVLATMNDALRKEFEDIAEETKKQAHRNVQFYHRIGERSRKIHADTQTYGEKAVEKLSVALDTDRGLIYKAIAFATLFDTAELKALMERQTSGGESLSWSHFSQLVHVSDKKQVLELIEVIMEQDLSVRGLRDELRRRQFSGVNSNRPAAPRSVMGGLSQLLTMTTKLNMKFSSEFDDSIFGPLEVIEDDQVTDEMIKRVTEGEVALTELAEQTAEKSRELAKLKDQLLKAQASAVKAKAKEVEEKEKEAAKEKAAKEKEAAAAAKEKEKEKAAKEKEKERAAKEKEKERAAKEKAKAKPGAKAAPAAAPAPAPSGARKRERRPIPA